MSRYQLIANNLDKCYSFRKAIATWYFYVQKERDLGEERMLLLVIELYYNEV
jgi:hypothetical protein